jgi:hypothetical protein
MFDNYVLLDKGFKNIEKNGKVIGYELQTFISYYRGIPLSMINTFEITVDRAKISHEKIKFSADGKNFFTLDEMRTVTFYKWEYGQPGIIFVEQAGGLSVGKHEVELMESIRISYIPVPFIGRNTKILEIV